MGYTAELKRKKKKQGFPMCFFAFFLMLCCSCTFLKQMVGLGVMKPTVRLESVSFQKITHNSVQLLVHLSVYNPNEFEVTLSKMNYQIEINDVLVGQGLREEQVTFPPESKQQNIRLPLNLNLQNSKEIFKKFLIKADKKLLISWNSKMVFHSGVGPIPLRFTDQKELAAFH